jgi:hypothetical protein
VNEESGPKGVPTGRKTQKQNKRRVVERQIRFLHPIWKSVSVDAAPERHQREIFIRQSRFANLAEEKRDIKKEKGGPLEKGGCQ